MKKVEINQTASNTSYSFEFKGKKYVFEVFPVFKGDKNAYYRLMEVDGNCHSSVFSSAMTETFTVRKTDLLRSIKKAFKNTTELPFIVDACLNEIKLHFEEQIRVLDDLKTEKKNLYQDMGFEYEG